MSPIKIYRPDIDGLRAIAVSIVVLFHAFPALIPAGFIGVDIFFVISGFLITGILLDELSDDLTLKAMLGQFYARRIKRIFPSLLVVLLTTLILAWFILLPDDYKKLGQQTMAGLGFVSNFLFWQQAGYFDGASDTKPLLHLWSLAIEEQFYIFFPLILLFFYRRKLNLTKALWWLFIVSVLINLYYARHNLTADFYSPLSRAWELLAGSLLAVYARRPGSIVAHDGNQKIKNWVSVGAIIFLILALYLIDKNRKFPGSWALLPVAVGVGFILAGPQSWFNQKILASKPFVWVGLISYPLYLWHWPLLVLGHHYYGTAFDWKIKLICIVLAVVLSALCYYFLEKPIRLAKQASAIILKVLIVLAVVIAYLGYSVYNKEGYAKRFPTIIKQITAGQGHLQEGWRVNTCMLETDVPASSFAPECIETSPKPQVFLWGDSHNASFYPGMLALQKSGQYTFALSQRTAAVCPPFIISKMRPSCSEANNNTLEVIRQTKPEIVVLYSLWNHHMYDLNQLAPTVQALKAAGVKKVVMMGLPVMWEGRQIDHVLALWRQGSPLAQPPIRSWLGVGKDMKKLDAKYAKVAEQAGIEYISMLQLLCNEEGCLTRPGINSTAPISYDYGHLTVPAATYVAQQLGPKILELPKQ